MTMVAPHLRQRILARRAWTFSSAMEYLAEQEGQEIFTNSRLSEISRSIPTGEAYRVGRIEIRPSRGKGLKRKAGCAFLAGFALERQSSQRARAEALRQALLKRY